MSVRNWPDRATTVTRSVVREFRREDISFMAGSIAYAAFVSMLPALLLAILVASFVGGEAFADYVIDLTRQYLSPAAQGLVTDALTQASERASFSVLGLVVLVWAVLKVFRFLDTAFSKLYDSPTDNGLADQLVDGLVVLLGIGVAVTTMVGVAVALAYLPDVPFLGLFSALFLVAALTIAFFPLYYVFPDVDVSVAEVLPGAVVAAIGWTVLQTLFRVYVSTSSTNELYGVIGGVILLVTWLYFASLVLLLGAATNVVLWRGGGRVDARPEPDNRSAPE